MKNTLKTTLLLTLLAVAGCSQTKTNTPLSNKNLEQRAESASDSTKRERYIRYGKGLNLIDDSKYGEAIKVFQEVLSFNYPDSLLLGLTYTNIGYAYSKLKKDEEAIESYKTALRIDSLNWRAYNNLASKCQEMGNIDEAEKHAQNAIRCAKRMIVPYITLAEVQLAQGNPNDAYNTLIEGERNCREIAPEMIKTIGEMKDKIRKRI